MSAHRAQKRKSAHHGKKKKFEGEEDSSSDEETEMLDVEFEFFDPQPAVDFHGIKSLLRQLFDADAPMIDLSTLADLILSQPTLGSTVKTDGNESDPYALLTIINMREHWQNQNTAIRQLDEYISNICSKNDKLHEVCQHMASNDSSAASQLGLILTERLINIPAQLSPPMYRMLLEEMQWAREDGEKYNFTHYLVLTRTYVEVKSNIDDDEDRPAKKKKSGGREKEPEVFYFHPEDEVIDRFAIVKGDYPFIKEGSEGDSDSKRAFQELGIRPTGHMALIEAGKLEDVIKAMETFVGN